jgi:hypothetical protein
MESGWSLDLMIRRLGWIGLDWIGLVWDIGLNGYNHDPEGKANGTTAQRSTENAHSNEMK